MIEARSVTKILGDKAILSNVSIRIDAGIVALLGPNGAGKTTLMRLLTGIWKPTEGSVRIDGHDLLHDDVAAKRALGYQPEFPDLHPELRPRELLDFAAAARSVSSEDLAEAVDRFGVAPLLDAPVGSLSMGQKRLVTLVAATMHRPPVLLLDEPTNALDPHRVAALKDYLRSPDAPRAALISTHQLDFVRTVAERFILLAQGQVAGDGTLDELREQFGMPGASLEEIVLAKT
ncbi:MAG TPA: ABC transporter ATP-binding protein [Thermoanaerobaculia bacterium]|nr:ABC transporter ATP-binding protein [Thermoanaerobaculia bacterium]